ncbi:DNA repair protein recN [Borrelia duttonii CR2A]|uniref:DNA repair protein recN n=1 Tax=Borrelia duttonii CR2A TaxID=1432657 RepID=W6TLZ5_9SPIR|nr:DNA repair protein recN [Borrelia duttonii CR2A]
MCHILIELFIKNLILIKKFYMRLNVGLFAFEDESDNIRGILLLSLFYYLFGYKIKHDVISNKGCRDVLVAKFQASDEL